MELIKALNERIKANQLFVLAYCFAKPIAQIILLDTITGGAPVG